MHSERNSTRSATPWTEAPVLRNALVCGMLAAILLAVYGQVGTFDFVAYDDPSYVIANSHVRGGLSLDGFEWAFTDRSEPNWHPVTWLSHMLDVSAFGLDPGAHHLINVLLHLINTLLLFGVLTSLTGSTWRSACVAALFAVHPIHVESVAWISERKDVLSTGFGLASLAAYVGYARHGGWARYALSACALALGLMSKPMLVTLPFVFLLIDHWPLNRLRLDGSQPLQPGASQSVSPAWMRVVAEKIPLLVLSVLVSVIAYSYQERAGSMAAAAEISLPLRLVNAVVSYAAYLAKVVWPFELAPHYPHPYLPEYGGSAYSGAAIALAVLLLVGLSLVVLATRRRGYPVVGWLWYLGTLGPVIGLVQVGTQSMADRYGYIPLMGIFLWAVWGGADLLAPLAKRVAWARVAAGVLACTCIAALAARSSVQVRHWRDSKSLLEHALTVVPGNPTMHVVLGNFHRDRRDLAAAIANYRAAIMRSPDFVEAHGNLGSALLYGGHVEAAIAHFRHVLQLTPQDAEAHVNLANALFTGGAIEEGFRHYRHALELDPHSPEAHYNFGNALFTRGDLDAAIEHYRLALGTRPSLAQAHVSLANALAARGEFEGSIEHFRRALDLRPEYPRANLGLQRALALSGRESAAP